jgi:hypothetical protein
MLFPDAIFRAALLCVFRFRARIMAASNGPPFPALSNPEAACLLGQARKCWNIAKSAPSNAIRNHLLERSVQLANEARILDKPVSEKPEPS